VPKLNQIVAIEKNVKATTFEQLSKAHHMVQKAPLLSGIHREYQPKDEQGDQLPSESTKVQVSAERVLGDVAESLAGLFDVVATKDVGNTAAKADVVVDGVTVAENLPISYLLWLEKQLTDLHTFVKKLPVLDPADDWTETEPGLWKTQVVTTTRTKKVPRNHVKAEATDRHPAQVETYFEDVLVGNWKTVKLSGAMPADRVALLLKRVERLQQAVKFAREQANAIEVGRVHVGAGIFEYLLSA
jgi:hypothetical protein